MAKLKTTNPYGAEFFETASAASPKIRSLGSGQAARSPGGREDAGSVRLNIELAKGLHRQLKRFALDQDRTIADVVRTLIASAVGDSEDDREQLS